MDFVPANEYSLDPFPHYARMREAAPVFHDEQSGGWHVFRYDDVQQVLSEHARFSSRLGGNHASIYEVTRRTFSAAGLDRTDAGTRLLRHNAATRLLRAGTPLPTISAVLGHSAPDSTNRYLGTDTEHMRACVLTLPMPQGA